MILFLFAGSFGLGFYLVWFASKFGCLLCWYGISCLFFWYGMSCCLFMWSLPALLSVCEFVLLSPSLFLSLKLGSSVSIHFYLISHSPWWTIWDSLMWNSFHEPSSSLLSDLFSQYSTSGLITGSLHYILMAVHFTQIRPLDNTLYGFDWHKSGISTILYLSSSLLSLCAFLKYDWCNCRNFPWKSYNDFTVDTDVWIITIPL